MEYTLEQLKKMGAKPVESPSYSMEQLNALGAKPVEPAVEQQLPAGTNTVNKDVYSEKTYGKLPQIADFLGISKFGTGIGRAINNLGGGLSNQVETTRKTFDALKQIDDKAISVLHDPKSTPEQIQQAKTTLQNNNKMRNDAVASFEDVTTAGLSSKEIAGSAANTALLAGASAIPGGVSGLTGKAALAAKAGIGAATGYGLDVANKANANEQNIFTPGFGTAIGASLPFAGALIGALAKKTTGVLTGAGETVIDRAVKNPDAISEAISIYAKSPEAKQTLVDRAKVAISDFLHQRSVDYGSSIDTLTSKTGFQGKQSAIQAFKDSVAEFGGTIRSDGNISFTDSTLTKGDQNSLKQAWSVIDKWKNTSVKGLDGLRQAIKNHMDEFSQLGNSRANVVLGKTKTALVSGLESNVTGYKQILSDYGTKTQTVKNLSKELSLGGQAKPSTQLAQIMRVFKKDPLLMKNISNVFGKEGASKFLDDISGAILSEWIPAGKMGNFVRAIGEGGAALLGFASHNPAILGTAGTALAASSPRVVGKTATLAGKAIQKGIPETARKLSTIGASKVRP